MIRQKAVKKNQSVGKVLQIIEIMAQGKGPMRLQDIAASLGLPPSTVLRFLNTLMENGYVHQDDDSLKYMLTMKFSLIGDQVSSQYSFRDVIHPYLLSLSEECQESACLAVEQEMTAVYVDVVDGPENTLRTLQRIGKTAPLHSTGVGKILMLNYDRDRLDRLVDEKGLAPLTQHTITDRQELVRELDRVRKQDYALDNEECEQGVRCVAAPIRDYSGRVIASISVTGPSSRMNRDRMERVREAISRVSASVSHHLGYRQGDRT